MRAFLEQYGIAIFTIIILGIMVLMANGVGLTVEDLLKGEIKRFATTAGEESWDGNKNKLKINEYGFYFDQPYVTNWDGGERFVYIFKENGEFHIYHEITEQLFNNDKEWFCEEYGLNPDTATVTDVNQKIKENPDILNATYDKLYFETDGIPGYFSDDGKKLYMDEERTQFEAKLLESRTTDTAYAIYSEDDHSLRFYKNKETPEVGGVYNGLIVTALYEDIETTEYYVVDENDYLSPEWHYDENWLNIQTVIFEDQIAPISTASWFWGFNFTSLDATNLNTSNTINMENMFEKCNLTSLNLSSFNTSKVTNMSYMFHGCTKLQELNINSFNTSNVTDMSYMFEDCWELTNLNLNNFDTSKVTNMSYMFDACTRLQELNLSSFNTSNVTDMSYMFSDCMNYVDFPSLNISNFNTSKVTNMKGMFLGTEFQNLDLSNFNTSNVTDMSDMFRACKKLKTLSISNFDTSNVTNMSYMFHDSKILQNHMDLTNFNTSNVTDMSYMFGSSTTLNSQRLYGTGTVINLTSFDTNKVTNCEGMFKNLGSWYEIHIGSNFTLEKGTDLTFDNPSGYYWGLTTLGDGTKAFVCWLG